MKRPSAMLFVAAMILLPARLAAQSAQAISIQVSGLFNGVFGDVFGNGVKSGYGAEGQLRYTPGAFSIGAGFQWTTHHFGNGAEDIRFYGGFFEPRFRIHTGSNVVAPYVSGRFSLLKVGFSGGDLECDSSYIQLNGGGGILYRVGSRVNLDLGATFGYDRVGSGTILRRSTGGTAPVPAKSGANLVMRVGFVLGIGG